MTHFHAIHSVLLILLLCLLWHHGVITKKQLGVANAQQFTKVKHNNNYHTFVVQFWNYSSHRNLSHIIQTGIEKYQNLCLKHVFIEPQTGKQVWPRLIAPPDQNTPNELGNQQLWRPPLTDFVVLRYSSYNLTESENIRIRVALEFIDNRIKRVFPNAQIKQNLLTWKSRNNNTKNKDYDDNKCCETDCSTSSIFMTASLTKNISSTARSPLMRGKNTQSFRSRSIPTDHNLRGLWNKGIRGQGISIAIVDSGLDCDKLKARFRNLQTCTDWTQQPELQTEIGKESQKDTLTDGVGHGTFVAGVVAGLSSKCGGVAPDVNLHVRLSHITSLIFHHIERYITVTFSLPFMT